MHAAIYEMQHDVPGVVRVFRGVLKQLRFKVVKVSYSEARSQIPKVLDSEGIRRNQKELESEGRRGTGQNLIRLRRIRFFSLASSSSPAVPTAITITDRAPPYYYHNHGNIHHLRDGRDGA